MDVNLQRKVDQMAGPFLCRLLSLFPLKNRAASNKSKPNRILIILLSEMGSLVLAQPVINRIKKNYPEASLYILLFSNVRLGFCMRCMYLKKMKKINFSLDN